jgi:hypothetical protein
MPSRKNSEDVTINDRKNQAHSGILCHRSALGKKKRTSNCTPDANHFSA